MTIIAQKHKDRMKAHLEEYLGRKATEGEIASVEKDHAFLITMMLERIDDLERIVQALSNKKLL